MEDVKYRNVPKAAQPLTKESHFKVNLIISLIFCLFNPVISLETLNFDFASLPSGAILEKSHDTLLSNEETNFDFLLRIAMPSLNITENSGCELDQSEKGFDAWKRMHSKMVELISHEMFYTLALNISENKIHSFVDKLMKSKDNEKLLNSARSRKRRALEYAKEGYFFLSSWTEDRLKNLTEWSNGHFSKVNSRIDRNVLALNATLGSLKSVQSNLCKLMKIELWQALESLRLSLILSLTNLIETVHEAKNSFLPALISDEFLTDFCISHFRPNSNSKFCENTNIRSLFTVSLEGVIFGDSLTVGLKMKVTIPTTDSKPHQIFRVRYIPVISKIENQNNSTTRKALYKHTLIKNSIAYVGIQTSGHIKNFEGLIGFSSLGCEWDRGINICHERAYVSDEKCVENLIFRGISEECQIETRQSRTDCVSHKLDEGTVVSSLNPVKLQIFSPNPAFEAMFQLKNKLKSGIFYISQSQKFSTLFSCGHRQVTVRLKKNAKRVIIDVKSFNTSISDFVSKPTVQNIDKLEKQVSEGLKNSSENFSFHKFWLKHTGLTLDQSAKYSGFNFIIVFVMGGVLYIFYQLGAHCQSKKLVTPP